MKEKVMCGIQQVGIGVSDVMDAMKWYKKIFGFDIKVFDDEGTAEKMLPYTGGKPQDRRAMLMYNMRGGGGFEIWQPKGRTLKYPATPPAIGDLGIFACKIKSPDIYAAYSKMKVDAIDILSEPMLNIIGKMHFFVRDPYGNIFDIEDDDYVFMNENKPTGGVNGVIVGVSDMDRSIEFYGKLLGYDKVVGDRTAVFDDFKVLNGSHQKLRRVLLKRNTPFAGPMSELMGTSCIELVQQIDSVPEKIYKERYWGDPGFIHLCFDIRNMEAIQRETEALGHPFVCDGGVDFDMGDANGHFTYVEDPDGMLIEFVETFKIPVLKKFGIYLKLKNKNDKKPLSRGIVKAIRFLRVK